MTLVIVLKKCVSVACLIGIFVVDITNEVFLGSVCRVLKLTHERLNKEFEQYREESDNVRNDEIIILTERLNNIEGLLITYEKEKVHIMRCIIHKAVCIRSPIHGFVVILSCVNIFLKDIRVYINDDTIPVYSLKRELNNETEFIIINSPLVVNFTTPIHFQRLEILGSDSNKNQKVRLITDKFCSSDWTSLNEKNYIELTVNKKQYMICNTCSISNVWL